MGMAVSDRVKLFRAQASRSVGGNGRRTSHNPPDPAMLDIYDRLGVCVMDENRQLSNSSTRENEMRALVKRDRNHPR
jgi:beta-galactosidase/beta-glucuronidase